MLTLLLVLTLSQPAASGFAKWEKSIAEIEKRLKAEAPKAGGIVFAGSSSIRLWDLKESFPDRHAINVGFGGSQIADSTHFADRIILPLKPKQIVFYAGDNDIAAKRTAEQVLQDFQAFSRHIHKSLPETKIYFLAIKPSNKRWEMWETQKEANRLVREYCAKDARLAYIDIVSVTLGNNGKPNSELFLKDELHLNKEGYKLWTEVVKQALK